MACKACVFKKVENLNLLYDIRLTICQLDKEKVIPPEDVEKQMVNIMNRKCPECDNGLHSV